MRLLYPEAAAGTSVRDSMAESFIQEIEGFWETVILALRPG
jgi:hypothetical protein